MLDSFCAGVLRHRKLIIAIFIAAFIVCAILQSGVVVNYDMSDYLPPDAPSTRALDVMNAEFTAETPNARVLLYDVSIEEALEYKEKLRLVSGITDVMFLDDVADLTVPLSTLNKDLVETYYRGGNALLQLNIAESMETPAMNGIYAIIGDRGAAAGEAVGSATYQSLAFTEVSRAFAFAIPAILIILAVSTTSWVEPLLFLISVGMAVIINMGTNRFFPSVSYVTTAISPILQLAVSLDYAVFLLDSFERHRAETPDLTKAMQLAMQESFPAVMASALTTLFGFLALVLMRFELGGDLGVNLAKGIVFSLIGALVFLPALTLSCVKLLDRTRHKIFLPPFGKLSNLILRLRVPLVILVLAIAVPVFMASRQVKFLYGTGTLDRATRAGQDEQAIIDTFGESTPMVVLVPRGEPAKEAALSDELAALPTVESVLSYAKTVGVSVPTSYLSSDIVDQFYSAHYARIVLYANTPGEGDDAFKLVEDVRKLASSYYGDEALSLGQSVSLCDIRDVIATDNTTVNLVAIAAIALVLLLTFRSASLPVILVLAIETAIWINLSVPYFANTKLSFVGYLVLSSVQLGATVDYAILYTSHYLRHRRLMPPLDAARQTAHETTGSILVSASILTVAGFFVGYSSTNMIVEDIGYLISRGTILSFALVLLFLPAALTLLDGLVEKTTRRTAFFHKGDS